MSFFVGRAGGDLVVFWNSYSSIWEIRETAVGWSQGQDKHCPLNMGDLGVIPFPARMGQSIGVDSGRHDRCMGTCRTWRLVVQCVLGGTRKSWTLPGLTGYIPVCFSGVNASRTLDEAGTKFLFLGGGFGQI